MIVVEPFAARLLAWLESISLQAAVLVGLALLLALAVRRASPRLRHIVWLVVLLRLAIPIELSSPLGLLAEPTDLRAATDPLGPRAGAVPAELVSPTESGPAHQPAAGASAPRPLRAGGASSWLAVSWIAGVVILLGIVLLRVRRASTLLAAASEADRSILAEVSDLSRRLGIEPPRVKIADASMKLPSPAAFGLQRPTILLPEALATGWTPSEREPLLVHELAHLRRRDLWINSLQLVVQTLYFFHPLVWFANRSLRVARELACDEDVARFYGAGSNRYPRALLRAARGEDSGHSSALAVTLATPRSLLGRRVESLLTRRAANPRRQSATLAVVIAGSLVIVALAAARPTRQVADFEVPADRKEWLAFVDELDADPARSQRVEAALIESVRSGEGNPERLDETLSMIRRPQSPFLGDRELRSAWTERLELLPTDLPTLRAAASFFTLESKPQAEALLRRGWEMQPGSAYWPLQLAHLEYLRRTGLAGADRAGASKRALALLEEARPIMTEGQLYPRLNFFARAAYGAGELGRAREYADQLLAGAPGREDEWHYGNALHHGHTVLGLVALAEGDRHEAVRRLLLSADTPGSPQLNSFGPSFKLAGDLLALGEHDAVLEYLARCGEFWASSRGRLESYVAAASAGKTPEFRDIHY